MTIYHDEKIIERCLQSVSGVVDEIVVLHDGECRDRTLEFAHRFTDKVIVSLHKGEAELHNNEILQYVIQDWFQCLDTDEFLSDDLRFHL